MVNRSTSNLHIDLGRIPYEECLNLQLKLVRLRKSGKIGNVLLFLEHDPPVYTIGRKSDPRNYSGVNVVKTDRGGDVTYHSPGQLVGYPIFNIEHEGRKDVRKFVQSVEGIIMDTLAHFGFSPYIGDEPGIWLKPQMKKVASLGMAIDDNVSYHGFAINLTEEPLRGFTSVNPCGMDPAVMGYAPVERSEFTAEIIRNFEGVFGKFNQIESSDLMDLASTLDR